MSSKNANRLFASIDKAYLVRHNEGMQQQIASTTSAQTSANSLRESVALANAKKRALMSPPPAPRVNVMAMPVRDKVISKARPRPKPQVAVSRDASASEKLSRD